MLVYVSRNKKTIPVESASWYYTRGYQFTSIKYGQHYIIRGCYLKDPERSKNNTRNKKDSASSLSPIFGTDIFHLFKTKEEAELCITAFRYHVEDIVRDNRPHKVHKYCSLVEHNLTRHVRYKVRCNAFTKSRRLLHKKTEYNKQLESRVGIIKDWQEWRQQSIDILQHYILNRKTCMLLKEPPTDGMVVSQHVSDTTLMKAISLKMFLYKVQKSDEDPESFDIGGSHTS